MRFLDEFSDPELARKLLDEIHRTVTAPHSIMEICGGQTHTILRHGLDQLLPDEVDLVHGPGCPVCVTPVPMIDHALELAARPGVIFCSFGDMLRVPGSAGDLLSVRAAGADVRTVYSPLDAVGIAEANPDLQVVFFAIGFETTAPANAMAVHQAAQRNLDNFSVLVSHVLVPPAIEAILGEGDGRIDALLAAGHVCAVMGIAPYEGIVARHRIPIVVTGFEPLDLLDGIRRAVVQLEDGRAELENAYGRAVRTDGNAAAQELVDRVFEVTDREWRGIGSIRNSGWRLAPAYRRFDAVERFAVEPAGPAADSPCRAGEVLLGLIRPDDCEAFGEACTPRHPLGAPMVSAEGACSAYHRYRGIDVAATP